MAQPKKKQKVNHSNAAVSGSHVLPQNVLPAQPVNVPISNQVQNAGAPAAPVKKKKRSKMKSDDRAHNGKQSRKAKGKKDKDTKPTNYARMRSNVKKVFVNANNKQEKVRTTVSYDKHGIRKTITFRQPGNHDKDRDSFVEKMHAEMAPQLEKVDTFREIIEVLEYNDKGSPIKVRVRTPQKKTAAQQEIEDNMQNPEDATNKEQYDLHRVLKVGEASFYESIGLNNTPLEDVKKKTAIEDDDDRKSFYASDAYQAIQKAHDKFKLKYKQQPVHITPGLLQKTNKENAENGGRREKGQNEAMAVKSSKAKDAGATAYVKATKLHDDKISLKWEWLHLVAHMILGKVSQDIDNLTAGSKHANTVMIFADVDIPYLSKMYPEGFDLELWADLVDASPTEATHIAQTIYYTITTKDFSYTLTFDAQNPNQPHIDFGEYMHIALLALVAVAKQFNETKPAPANANQNGNANATQNNQNNNAATNQNNNAATTAPSTNTAPRDDHKFLFHDKKIPVSPKRNVKAKPKNLFNPPNATNSATANPANAAPSNAPNVIAPNAANVNLANAANISPANPANIAANTPQVMPANAANANHPNTANMTGNKRKVMANNSSTLFNRVTRSQSKTTPNININSPASSVPSKKSKKS